MKRTPRVKFPPVKDMDTPKELIRLVQAEPLLWNEGWPDYHNHLLREGAWARIGKRFFGFNGEKCALLWKSLRKWRSNHRRRREERVRSGMPSKRKLAPFKYDAEMSFLDQGKGKDVQEGNLNSDESAVNDSLFCGSEVDSTLDSNDNVISPSKCATGLEYSMQRQFEEDCRRLDMSHDSETSIVDARKPLSEKQFGHSSTPKSSKLKFPTDMGDFTPISMDKDQEEELTNLFFAQIASDDNDGEQIPNPIEENNDDEMSLSIVNDNTINDNDKKDIPKSVVEDLVGDYEHVQNRPKHMPTDENGDEKSKCVQNPKPHEKSKPKNKPQPKKPTKPKKACNEEEFGVKPLKPRGRAGFDKENEAPNRNKVKKNILQNKEKIGGHGRRPVQISKKVKFDNLDTTYDTQSGGDSDGDDAVQDMIREKGKAKVAKSVAAQEKMHEKREERRNRIYQKIKSAKAAQATFQKFDCKASPLELALAGEFMKNSEHEEKPMTLLCLSWAARLEKLPLRTANQLTSSFKNELDAAEEDGGIPSRYSERRHGDYDSRHTGNGVGSHQPAKNEKKRPILTPVMEVAVDKALLTDDNEVVVTDFNIIIKGEDIKKLLPTKWLTDNIINFYMKLIMQRSLYFGGIRTYTFNTFFLTSLIANGLNVAASWTRDVDIFSFQKLLVPVHDTDHWCMLCIDMQQKQMTYYDNLKRKNGMSTLSICAMKIFLITQMRENRDRFEDEKSFTSDFKENLFGDVPEQNNGSDCGAIACAVAETLARTSQLDMAVFNEMEAFRRRMVYEIVTKKLL